MDIKIEPKDETITWNIPENVNEDVKVFNNIYSVYNEDRLLRNKFNTTVKTEPSDDNCVSKTSPEHNHYIKPECDQRQYTIETIDDVHPIKKAKFDVDEGTYTEWIPEENYALNTDVKPEERVRLLNYKVDVADDTCIIKKELYDINESPYAEHAVDEVKANNESSSTSNASLNSPRDYSFCNEIDIVRRDVKKEITIQEPIAVIVIAKRIFYKRNFVCNICYDIFISLRSLSKHKAVVHGIVKLASKLGVKHSSKESFRFKADQAVNLNTFMAKVNREKHFECDKCDRHFSTEANLLLHNKIHSFSTKSSLKVHEICIRVDNALESSNCMPNQRILKCDQCDFTCSGLHNLNGHRKKTHDLPFKCDVCDFRCARSSTLKYHKMIHSNVKPHGCDQCDFKSRTPHSLVIHKRIHSGERPYKCDECQKKFSHSFALKEHKMAHTGEKPYKCELCDYKCIKRSNLKIHMLTHTGLKPFKCDQCDFTAVVSSYVKSHKLSHSTEKPFECDICDYKCVRPIQLQRHKLIHSNEMLFSCECCDYKAKTMTSVKRHTKSQHLAA